MYCVSSVINNVQKVFILIQQSKRFAHYINFEYLQLTYMYYIIYISNLLCSDTAHQLCTSIDV